MKYKNADDLEPGDEIVMNQQGHTDIVTDRTERDQYGGCTIFTRNATTITGLPCPVKVVN